MLLDDMNEEQSAVDMTFSQLQSDASEITPFRHLSLFPLFSHARS
jgi:hypothetical protein